MKLISCTSRCRNAISPNVKCRNAVSRNSKSCDAISWNAKSRNAISDIATRYCVTISNSLCEGDYQYGRFKNFFPFLRTNNGKRDVTHKLSLLRPNISEI